MTDIDLKRVTSVSYGGGEGGKREHSPPPTPRFLDLIICIVII